VSAVYKAISGTGPVRWVRLKVVIRIWRAAQVGNVYIGPLRSEEDRSLPTHSIVVEEIIIIPPRVDSGEESCLVRHQTDGDAAWSLSTSSMSSSPCGRRCSAVSLLDVTPRQ
jgi:hypothetical protein